MAVKNVIFSLNELNLCIEKNMYWVVRCIVLYIQERLYKIVKLYRKKNKENTFKNVTLHIFDKKDLSVSKIALQDALAINHGISSAKNISNLPPNICNPLYLSRQALKLSEKYKSNIVVDIIDIKKMKELGMNAYVAVGSGAKNKPYMSIIKYTGDTCTNDKKIILIGKGMTFDSGGISIKPATDMHEMKYDMCGAASVYGVLIAALKLHLPLKIIGILAGCENMISSSSFRPGDVIKTMSGKTIEVLNTDAEGRLVLCDVLKYIEKFSPDIVIDIATLTGACITALGESISGLFSNNDHLCCQIEQAAKETDDTVWRLPLFQEYKKGLFSSVADLSNIGKSKAGAITAACFLSCFTEKYHWAHLDIAGTAWKSKTFEGATGRPVELLSQFLLNISK